MADEAAESAYVQLLKGTVLNLQDRVNQEKKRLARINMYPPRHVYHPYHNSISPPRIKPTYPSHSLVFVNPKMNYTKVNSKHTTKVAAPLQAAASTSLCGKYPALSVNRTFINPRNNLTLKKDHLTNGPVKSAIVAQTSSSQLSTSSSSSMDSQSQASKGDALKKLMTESKVSATASTSLGRKKTSVYVNRAFINQKNILALKPDHLTNNPKASEIVAQTSSSQLDNQNQTSKEDSLKDSNTESKVTASTSQATAAASTSLCIEHAAAAVNPKNNLALKKEPVTNSPETGGIVAQTSSSHLCPSTASIKDSQKQSSKGGDALKKLNTESKISAAISHAAASSFLRRKKQAVSINRTFINRKNNLTLKKGTLSNGPKTNANLAQTSSQLSKSTVSSMDSQNQTSKGDALIKGVNTGSKPQTLNSRTQQQNSTAATSLKSTSEKPVLKSPVNSISTASRTCITSSTPKSSSAGTYLSLSKSRHVSLKSPATAASLSRRFVERHRYKIVREHKPAASKTVASIKAMVNSASPMRLATVNTRFNLVKRQDVSMHKNGYSYISKRCLLKAKGLKTSEAGRSYVRKLRKLIIDAGKKLEKKPLVMVSRRKISRVPVQSTPTLPKRKSSVIPHKSKLKVDHRSLIYNFNSSKILISPLIAKHKLSPENQRKWFLGSKRFFNTKFSKLQTVTVQGIKYRVEAGGKNLRRLDSELRSLPSTKVTRIHIGGAIFTRTSTGHLKRVNTHKLIVANRVVNKSIATAFAKNRRVQSKPAKKPCLYFNNFGKCKNVKCPYVHDPKKIAVCRRMIQGTCKVSGCPFYHKLDKEKMPTCYYFLRGKCNRDNCIYPHVKVNKNAKTCEDFLNGYCSRGEKCTMKHFFVCQKFQEKQVCSHNACKFKAHQITKAKTSTSAQQITKSKTFTSTNFKTSQADQGKRKKSMSSARSSSLKKSSGKLVPSSEPIPITENLSFISLGNSSEDSFLDVSGSAEPTSHSDSVPKAPPKESLRIKPRL